MMLTGTADKKRVVYDAGVVLQAVLNPKGPASQALSLMDANAVKVFLSPHTRDEIEDILARPDIRQRYPHLTDERAEAMLRRLDDKTTLIPTVPRSIEFPRDPDDEPVLNLAIYVKANYIVARDKDLLELGQGRDFRLLFPFVRIVDPVAFSVEMEKERSTMVIDALRFTWQFEPESTFEVEWTGPSSFRLTEIMSDLSVGKRVSGYLHGLGGIVSVQDPELSFEQARVYDAILPDFQSKIRQAKEQGLQRFFLMKDGDYPDLFPSLAKAPDNIAGNVKAGMLQVWHALEHILMTEGYRVYKSRKEKELWEIWAQPLNTP